MAVEFKLDRAGISQLLKSPRLAAIVTRQAEEIGRNVETQGIKVAHGEALPVTVDPYTTDRAAASVTISHPAGLAVQAKYGALTKAAAQAGLEVVDR